MPEKIWTAAESATCFDFNVLTTRIKKSLQKRYPEKTGEDFQALLYKSLKTFTINNQKFDFVRLPGKLGGFRWYVTCPKCGEKCFNLYLPTGYKDKEQLYLCKLCHKLKNFSLMLGNSKKYVKVYRPLKRMEKIKKLLLKRGMTPEKAQPYLAEYQKIESELAVSPEYRLWKFQREHDQRA